MVWKSKKITLVLRNEPFRNPKRTLSECETNPFACPKRLFRNPQKPLFEGEKHAVWSRGNIKRLIINKLSTAPYFAYLRPRDFYFEKTAFSSICDVYLCKAKTYKYAISMGFEKSNLQFVCTDATYCVRNQPIVNQFTIYSILVRVIDCWHWLWVFMLTIRKQYPRPSVYIPPHRWISADPFLFIFCGGSATPSRCQENFWWF